MSQKALFITEKQLKDASVINENVSMFKLRPTIIMCQEMHIQPIVGSDIYKELQTQIIGNTLSPENETLLSDYIQPCLQMWIMMELPLVLGFQFRNKNIERGTDTNSTQSSVEELQKLMDNYRNKAEWYSERVTRFLLANDGDYPLYSNPTSEIDTILPTRRNYTSGMVLDRSGCCGSFSEKYQANYNRTCCD
jgi:hypothetical protein